MLKSIINFGIGCIAGGTIGWLAVREYYARQFDMAADDIFNEAYAEAKKELNKVAEEEKSIFDKKEHRKIIENYTKPDLNEVLQKSLGERFVEVHSDEELTDASADDDEPEPLEKGESGIISEHDFYNSCEHFNKTDLFYYSQDGIFTDDGDEIFVDDFFELMRGEVLSKINQHGKVYLRNAEIETDFEIHRLNLSFHENQYETPKERERRISKLKMRESSKTAQDEF